MDLILKVREGPGKPWVQNFSNGGWKVRDPSNGQWITMTPQNTKVRSADNTNWLNPK